MGLPRWFPAKESMCQCSRHKFHPSGSKTPWRRVWQPAPVFLPGGSHGQRSLVGYSPWGLTESDTTEQLGTEQYLINLLHFMWVLIFYFFKAIHGLCSRNMFSKAFISRVKSGEMHWCDESLSHVLTLCHVRNKPSGIFSVYLICNHFKLWTRRIVQKLLSNFFFPYPRWHMNLFVKVKNGTKVTKDPETVCKMGQGVRGGPVVRTPSLCCGGVRVW